MVTKTSNIKIKQNQSLYVIGDIHGDYDSTINILRLCKCIKMKKSEEKKNNNYDINLWDKIKWNGGDSCIIQLGDILDSKKRDITFSSFNDNEFHIIQLFVNLHKQALKVGGSIYLLVGNHEIMNMIGDFRHVSQEALLKQGGIINRLKFFKPGGFFCNYMKDYYKAILIINNYIFVHGSIHEKLFEEYSVDDINNLLVEFMEDKKNMGDLDIYKLFFDMEYSIVWSRYFSKNLTNEKCIELNNILKLTKTKALFLGHTFQKSGINSMCNKKLWFTDVGISGAFNKTKLECIEIKNNKIKIIK